MSGEQPDVGDPDGIAALAGHWHAKADAVTDALAKLTAASDATTSDAWKGVHDPIGYAGGTGYFDYGTEALNNVARATMNGGAGMTPADAAGMSDHDKTLFDNMMGPSL